MSPAPVSGQVAYEGSVRNFGDQVINDVIVRLCRSDNDPCSDPIEVVSPEEGVVRFSVDATFNGYVELEGPGLMPALVELSRPIGAMRTLPEFKMVEPFVFKAFASQLAESVSDDLGHLLYWVNDCSAERAAGATVTPLDEQSPSARGYYVLDSKFPSSAVDQTEVSGGGGFVNLSPGYRAFVATRASDGEEISRFPARVRAGFVTFVLIEPE